MGRILVIGATGLIGAPVARRLAAGGHQVRLLVRDTARARYRFGDRFEYVEGSVTDTEAVDRAVLGMDGVHVSLGVENPAQLETVEHQGTAAVATAVAWHGLERISYLTGSLDRFSGSRPSRRWRLPGGDGAAGNRKGPAAFSCSRRSARSGHHMTSHACSSAAPTDYVRPGSCQRRRLRAGGGNAVSELKQVMVPFELTC